MNDMFPYALIPAATASGTLHPHGREFGIIAGANVIMPNLSSVKTRKLYELYDNKISVQVMKRRRAALVWNSG